MGLVVGSLVAFGPALPGHPLRAWLRSRPLTLREGDGRHLSTPLWIPAFAGMMTAARAGYSVQVLPRKATAAGSTLAPRPGPWGMIRCPFSTRS